MAEKEKLDIGILWRLMLSWLDNKLPNFESRKHFSLPFCEL